MAFHYEWSEFYSVQKLQFLKAGIVLGYASDIQNKLSILRILASVILSVHHTGGSVKNDAS